MHIYYVAGVPYSDDLYHSGVKGQKWGIRRYQYEDGTLTPLGKIHYGAQKVGRAIGDSAKKIHARRVEKHKIKHPEKMTDTELRDHINRIKMENEYREMMRQNKKPVSVGHRIVNDILESSAKSLASGIMSRLNSKWESEAAYKRKVKQDKKDYKRRIKRQDDEEAKKERKEHDKERKTMSYKFDKYVKKTLPKDFSDYKDEDWENFDTFTNIKDRIRQYESKGGGNQGKKKKGGGNN